MENNIYEIFLKEIKRRYNSKEVSAMIGAGFSKNVYNQMPNWDELLFEMICEIYGQEIDSAYANYKHHHIKSKSVQSEEEFTAEYAQKLSKNIGYLNIVSKYIEVYGFRECVELYIEKYIPYMDIDNRCLNFGDGRVELFDEQNLSLHKKLLQLSLLNAIYTTNYDNFLEEIAKKEVSGWKVIDNSSKLKLSAEKSPIIKIHGNIRRSANDRFFFDGCHNHRYIISKDDYETYPYHHEAFMQLMKISLLRETFVLFGFSGQDPNFIAWVKWVKDVLTKDINPEENYNDPNYYKIFIFAITDENPNEIDSQFYRNHRIKFIPVLNPEFLQVIKVDPKDKDKSQLIKSAIAGTYDYLAKEDTYNKLWSKANNNKEVDISVLNDIIEKKSANRILKSVQHQEMVLRSVQDSTTPISAQRAALYTLALNDTKYPVDYYSPFDIANKINDSLLDPNLRKVYEANNDRFDTLRTNGSDCDFELTNTNHELDYNNILKIAFSLNFSKLKELVYAWKPDGIWLQRKAMFIALFDRNDAERLLLDYLETEANVSERYHTIILLNYISQTIPVKYSILSYENQGIDNLHSIKDDILNQLTSNKTDVNPYGWTGIKHTLGENHTKYLASIRFIQFLLDTGLLVQLGMTYFVDNKSWYLVAKELFNSYPFAVLWFTIQCNNNNVVKRIGQEYAYSDNLQEYIPDIIKKLSIAYFCADTPRYMENSVLQFISPLFISVPVAKWERFFQKVWTDKFYNKLENGFTQINIKPFIKEGMPYIKSNSLKNKIICNCIKMYSKENHMIFEVLSKMHSPANVNKETSKGIDRFIAKLKTGEELVLLHILSSIKVLSDEQVENIGKQILLLEEDAYTSTQSINALAHFTQKSIKENLSNSLLKSVILNNQKLWNVGIIGRSATQPDFISLGYINKWISWTNDEVQCLFDKLVEQFQELKQSSFFNKTNNDHSFSGFVTYTDIFNEMLKFLIEYESSLSNYENYSCTKKEIDGYLNADLPSV